MSKKNIDKLFQEKFEDFNEIPEEKVWNAISQSLDKKKSRRAIPIWWKLGGVAALLTIMFVIINPFEDNNIVAPVITDVESTEKENRPTENKKSITTEEVNQNQVAGTNTTEENFDSGSSENREVDSGSILPRTKKADVTVPKNKEVEKSALTTSDSEKALQQKNIDASEQAMKNIEEPSTAIVEIDKTKSKEAQKTDLEKNVPNENLGLKSSGEEGIANTEKEKGYEEVVDEPKRKSILDEIKNRNEEEETLAENSKSRWSVGANLAPVYFSSFGEGSPIDPVFNTNSKSGEFNMSYGLSVAYSVTDKLSVRSGINKVDFGYDTNEVEFSASLQGSLSDRLNNVNYNASAENVIVESKRVNTFALENKGTEDFVSNASLANPREGQMAQDFGYIEVPLELDYALIESRFGLNLIGGFSTLFLTNNSVVLNDSNETIELGEANNLNNVNFSTNVGFGLNYKFSPKVRLNVEPVFKYQLGTFSDTSGSFNPFSIGVYSGLNFKF